MAELGMLPRRARSRSLLADFVIGLVAYDALCRIQLGDGSNAEPLP